ncbi:MULTISPECIES: RidA family protein [unclassified Bacillus (in: firmicutes)]|uniref:RidA family protein n=1 Tax=unclassified Bacillus (in: firmicutes) TaxID=185979 RepID=UPI000BF15A41|nr:MULTISPECIES: RidA family protein [unclassified Bacillus (in: firmicutes)]PEJ56879.1 enamine deaminase RidA [Bacillus sp. AFS002410]PEL11390.1 enamine deaminase RidA [Bacillus sp. AFS017336]
MEIKKVNPEAVAAPLGQYSHITIVPRNAELVVLSGQVGNDKNGNLPKDIESQFENALENIKRILESEKIDLNNIFKINFWLTENIDRQFFLDCWGQFHAGNPPATTYAYVSSLVNPNIKIEVEAWAAR